MRFKQQGALHLVVLVALLATMIGIAFTVLYFLDRATLNRAHNDRELSARQSNPQVRPMTVDNDVPQNDVSKNDVSKKPLNINDALQMLNQPELENFNTPESTGTENSDSQPAVALDTDLVENGSESTESEPSDSEQDLSSKP